MNLNVHATLKGRYNKVTDLLALSEAMLSFSFENESTPSCNNKIHM